MIEKKACNMTFSEIKELAELVAEKNLGKIAIKSADGEIIIEGKREKIIQANSTVNAPASQPVQAVSAASAEEKGANASATVTAAPSGNVVKAPLIGTFYSASSPDNEPFVKAGQKVKKGDVIFIIESMKLMNEIQSEYDGTVNDIMVKNGDAVEYDQPIMVIGE